MRPRQEYDSTTNRSVYNKLRKQILEKDGEIRCSRCGYNRGENDYRKWYGCVFHYQHGQPERLREKLRWPSWKLRSKKRKQWQAEDPEINEGFNRIGWYYAEIIID